MNQYDQASYRTAAMVLGAYSTSFRLASRLFSPAIRPHIQNVYALVRIADEIVDTYDGADKKEVLDGLEAETYAALDRGYSANMVVHAFQSTARRYGIQKHLLEAFFASMRMDIEPNRYDEKLYKKYIYGSAEVVGLMCLRIFTPDDQTYERLAPGAQRLGAAFQKVNFLRDLADDSQRLGRYYFPFASFDLFDEAAKQLVIADIKTDFEAAAPALHELPDSARPAVAAATKYYRLLLEKLEKSPVSKIKEDRIRIPNSRKAAVLGAAYLRGKSRRR